MVTLTAGCYKEEFTLHKEVACLYSPVLAKAFGRKTTFHITADDAAVRRLVQWLYSQEIVLHTFHKDKCNYEYYDISAEYEPFDLIDLWVLAKSLAIPALKSLVITSLDKIYQQRRDDLFECVIGREDQISRESNLWKYLVAIGAQAYKDLALMDRRSDLPAIYVFDVMQYACERMTGHANTYSLSDYCEASD